MEIGDFNNLSPYIRKRLEKIAQRKTDDGCFCKFCSVGETHTPYVICINQHAQSRLKARIEIQNAIHLLNVATKLIENNTSLGNVIEMAQDNKHGKRADGSTEDFSKVGVFVDIPYCFGGETSSFLYLHIYEEYLEIATIISDKTTYFCDPVATPVWVMKNNMAVVGFGNTPRIKISSCSKYRKIAT